MRINLFGLGLVSRSKAVTPAQMTNLYCEIRPEGEKSRVVAYGMPGLIPFTYIGAQPSRGMRTMESEDLLFTVNGSAFNQVDNAGTVTNRGTLETSTGRCSLDHNGAQVLIVDGTYGYTYTVAGNVFAKITDAQFPSNPQTVTYQDGYFIVNKGGTNEYAISAPYDGTSWASLDYGAAESNPDDIMAVWADSSDLMLFGQLSTEFHHNTGNADFPYEQIPGATTEWGLAARWSVAKYDNTLACLMRNRMGQVMVAKLNGYLPEKLSTPDLDDEINSYSGYSDASAYSYMLGGHPMYHINFPFASRSWLYDGLTKRWHKRKSWGIDRYRGEMAVEFLGNTIVADYENGWLYKQSTDAFDDNGRALESEIVSDIIAAPDLQRFVVDRLRIDMEAGVGLTSGQGSAPVAMLQVSDDCGKTWSNEMWEPIGALGVNRWRVEWRRLGVFEQAVFKVRITDPVKRVITSAILNPQD